VLKEAWLNMGGPAKYIKRMTNGTNDVTKWTGVKVEGGRVTGIVWIKQGFTERISPEFARLKKLDKLIISFNKLRGRIPKELAQLKHLRMLFLDNNELELRDVPKAPACEHGEPGVHVPDKPEESLRRRCGAQ